MNDFENGNEMEQEVTQPVETGATTEKLLRLAVIGTGNCGCMMADKACNELGIDGVAINGSVKDLNLLTSPKIVRVQVGDGKGTGKDRNKAKEFFLADSGLVLDKAFIKVIEDNDVIFISTSTGGGYGSGSSTELAELLMGMYPEKIFIMVGVLPFTDEGYAAYEGTRAWLSETLTLGQNSEDGKGVSYMIYDNNRYAHLSPNKAAAMINNAFISDLRVIQGDFLGTTLTGGIDERDMLTVLSAPGRIVVDMVDDLEVSNVVEGSLIKTIHQHLTKHSAHAELVSDKEITASATMYILGDEFDEFKKSIKSDLQETFGAHVKDTSNFCDEDGSIVALIVSGLTEPAMVIDRILNKLKKLEDTITTRKSTVSKLDKVEAVTNSKLHVSAKQSFAAETAIVKSQEGGKSKEELLKRFLDKKKSE